MTTELPFLCHLRIFDEITENGRNDDFFAIFDKNQQYINHKKVDTIEFSSLMAPKSTFFEEKNAPRHHQW